MKKNAVWKENYNLAKNTCVLKGSCYDKNCQEFKNKKYSSCLKCKEDKELFNGQCYDTNFTCSDKNCEKYYNEEMLV